MHNQNDLTKMKKNRKVKLQVKRNFTYRDFKKLEKNEHITHQSCVLRNSSTVERPLKGGRQQVQFLYSLHTTVKGGWEFKVAHKIYLVCSIHLVYVYRTQQVITVENKEWMKHKKIDSVFSRKTWLYLRERTRQRNLKINKCDCKDQFCKGKFVRKYKWQTHCQWEMLKRGLIKNTKELVSGKEI